MLGRLLRRKKVPRAAEAETVPPSLVPNGDSQQGLSYLVANLQGIGRRENQEDSFAFGNALDPRAVEENGLTAVVADGMGGLKGGKLASETAVAAVLAASQTFDREGDLAAQLRAAAEAADDAVFGHLRGAGGSTLVAAFVFHGKLYFVSVGDSYLFLLRNRRLFRLNRSHNVLNRDWLEALEAGQSDPLPALRNPEREAITQFLGMGGLDEMDGFRRPLTLEAGDVLLLCSDGVGGVLSEDCLGSCLSHGTPEDMAQALEEEIRNINLKYQDNYTALIIQCRG